MRNRGQEAENRERPEGEQGFMLLGLVVAIACILIALSVAASKAAFSVRRDREVESARRADQYVRAIRRFYLKNQHYPGSIEQLENTNNVRYLRKRYTDPLTGKGYRLIPVGKNQTTVKGFFGQPLAGIANAGLGAVAGMQSPGIPGPTTAGGAGGSFGAGSFGASPGGAGGATGGGGAAGSSGITGATGAGGTAGAGGTMGAGGTAGAGGTTDATTNSGSSTGGSSGGLPTGLPTSTGPIMGVGSTASGTSILEPNEQSTYQTWEFLYDPRIEKLKAAAALNAGVGSIGGNSLGSAPGAAGSPTAPSSGNSINSTNPTNAPGNSGATPGGTTPSPQQ